MPKRRGKGEGTVYRAGDRDKYRAVILEAGPLLRDEAGGPGVAGPAPGRRRAGPAAPARGGHVAGFMRRWLEVSARPSVRPPTYRQYEQ